MFGNLLQRLRGSKKHAFQEYGHRVIDLVLPVDGPIQYAQWLHPGEFGNTVRQENVDFYRQFVKAGDFSIDIGANEGDTTVPLALAVGKNGLVLGLEPNPHAYKVLEANAALNPDKTRIIPLNFAATSTDGEFTFGSGDASFGNGGIVGFTHNRARNVRFTFKVQGRNLQDYLFRHHTNDLNRLSLIKVDAEGYDKEILKTIPRITAEIRPYLITELFGPATATEKLELYDLLSGFGYSLFWLSEFVPGRLSAVSRQDVTRKKTINIMAIPNDKVPAHRDLIDG